METNWNEKSLLSECQKEIASLVDGLPDTVDPAGLSLKNKIPFKALSLQELLRHRLADLSQAALSMYSGSQVIPAFVLTRACIETSSLLYLLNVKVTRFLENHDEDALDGFLVRALLGNRDVEEGHSAINVLSAIDRVNKEYDGFRQMYDGLSEYTHPNYRGVLVSYGKVDTSEVMLKVGLLKRSISRSIGLAPLLMSLTMFANCYNELEGMIQTLSEFFDEIA